MNSKIIEQLMNSEESRNPEDISSLAQAAEDYAPWADDPEG